MLTKKFLIISGLLMAASLKSQSVTQVYKINDLLSRIDQGDTTYIVNFWATWCKPCVQELPSFDSLYIETRLKKVKVLLVSIDFKEDLDKKVNPFLKKNAVRAECVLLDEVNGNDFINKIHPKWSGAIPGTLFKRGNKTLFIENKLDLKRLEKHMDTL